MLETIIQTRLAGKVQRAHIIPHQGSYSVAEHSWGVAMLCMALWPDSPGLLPYALSHDVHEGWLGDVPANVKDDKDRDKETKIHNALGLPYRPIQLVDKLRLRAADSLELYLWCYEQAHSFGNTYQTLDVMKEIERRNNECGGWPEPAQGLFLRLVCGDLVKPSGPAWIREILK
jgi:5'-deoxynucleotidase YfbR-like HD superfamily hydrolase